MRNSIEVLSDHAAPTARSHLAPKSAAAATDIGEPNRYPVSYALHRAARAQHGRLWGRIFSSASRAIADVVRRVVAQRRQRERADAIYSTLHALDARTLRDLGLHRSEIGSVAAELTAQADSTRRQSVTALDGPNPVDVTVARADASTRATAASPAACCPADSSRAAEFARASTGCGGNAAAPRPTVVLLHSSASSARQWRALIEALRPRFCVHAIDLHGHGARAAWRGPTSFSLAADAALVAPLLARSGGVHLVGHSYGAAVALKLAIQHPARVRSVIAYEPVLFRSLLDDLAYRPQARQIVGVAATIRNELTRGRADKAARHFVDCWSGVGTWQAMPPDRRQAITKCMPVVAQQCSALFAEPDFRAQLAALDVPLLFVTGAQTVDIARRLGDILRHSLPRAEHEIVDAVGHMAPITHAEHVNRRIVRFLDAHALALQAPTPSPDLRLPLRAGGALQLKSMSVGVKCRCNPQPPRCDCLDNNRINFAMKHRSATERMTIAVLAAAATVNWLLLAIVAPSASLL